ncbi:MAG: pyruvate kinase [Planctomycetota bacterium]
MSERATALDQLERLGPVARDLAAVRTHALDLEAHHAHELAPLEGERRVSGRNLLHYLALRSYDLRELQLSLSSLGLSSLGRAESHALAALRAVERLVAAQLGEELPEPGEPDVSLSAGRRLIEERAHALLGPVAPEQQARIMVTLPSEAQEDYALVRALVEAGMDVARVNCSHDDAPAWRRMAAHVRAAARELSRPCKVQLDLAGPKLRTGELEPGPRLARWRPLRDQRGRVRRAARVWLAPAEVPPPGDADAWLPLPADWVQRARPGGTARLRDARGRKRQLEVTAVQGAGCWAECARTAYVESGTKVRLGARGGLEARVDELPPLEQALELRQGDRLLLTADPRPGRLPRRGRPARIPCTLPEALPRVRVGEQVRFDDGRLEGIVLEAAPEQLLIEITRTQPGGSRLRADQGINFPDSELGLPALTPKDLADLDAVVELADLIGISFLSERAELAAVREELGRRGAGHLGVVLKVETRRAFDGLPGLLLELLRFPAAGVMIARGDLAVECGYTRLAEVQEEILWLCEAAHLPVVWATQVLESLAKHGLPSRAEITDAAMANRAECVMLNKGPHVVHAIRTLRDILRRMRAHQDKKSPQLRSLNVSGALGPRQG